MGILRFDRKVAIITGAGRGLGREYARMLASRGAQVVVNDLGVRLDGTGSDDDPARIVAAEINTTGGTATANRSSVVDSAAQIVECTLDTFGRLDILVNNAGFGGFEGPSAFASMPARKWDHMLDTHLGGTVNMSRAAWPYLRQSGAGRIINMSSAAAFGAPSMPHYATAKSAMIGLTRSLAGEGQHIGLSVNAIMPSAFTRGTAQIPDDALRDYMSAHFMPEDVAPFVAWLAHETTRISGEIFAVGGGAACRVVLARGQGIKAAAKTPEAWAAEAAQVMASGHLSVPLNSLDALCCELGLMDEKGKALAAVLGGKASIYSNQRAPDTPASSGVRHHMP